MSAPPLLTLRSASVSFGATRALTEASLELRRGDRLALVMPAGQQGARGVGRVGQQGRGGDPARAHRSDVQ